MQFGDSYACEYGVMVVLSIHINEMCPYYVALSSKYG